MGQAKTKSSVVNDEPLRMPSSRDEEGIPLRNGKVRVEAREIDSDRCQLEATDKCCSSWCTEAVLLRNPCDAVESSYGEECRKSFGNKMLLVGMSNCLMRFFSLVFRHRAAQKSGVPGLGINMGHFTSKILIAVLTLQFSMDFSFIGLSFLSKKVIGQWSELIAAAILNTLFFFDSIAFVINPFCLIPVRVNSGFNTDVRSYLGEDPCGLGIIVSVILINVYFNAIFRIRLWISFWFQLGNVLVFVVGDLVYLLVHSTSFELSHAMFAIFATSMSIIGLWLSERRDRQLFLHYQESEHNLSSLVGHIVNRQRHPGSSKLEDLLDMLLSVEMLARIGGRHDCGVSKRIHDMREIVDLSQRCVSIVMSGDLFVSHLGINPELNDDLRCFILDQQGEHIAMLTTPQSEAKPGPLDRRQGSSEHRPPKKVLRGSRTGDTGRRPSTDSAPPAIEVPPAVHEPKFKFPAALDFVGRDATKNVLTVEAEMDNPLLSQMGFALLKQMGSLDILGCPDEVALTFLQRIEKLYFPTNPYHNATHASSVAHHSLTFFNILEASNRIPSISKDLSKIGLWIAALAHDVNHPAKSNAYLINSQHSLATVYNDIHVLENFHCAVTFQTLQGPKCNVFENLSKTQYAYVRGLIVDLILATDMKEHFDIMARFRVAHANSTLTDVDSLLTLKVVIKAADIGHSIFKWDDHLDWSVRVVAEFYAQGDEEGMRHMEKSPLCDRSKLSDLGESQAGFLHFVVQPLYEELALICEAPAMQQLVRTIQQNVEKWKTLDAAAQKDIEERVAIWQLQTDEGETNRPGSRTRLAFLPLFQSSNTRNLGEISSSTSTVSRCPAAVTHPP
eukprot:GHVN01034388.1.p1 GENE.GHVN01034388.1~~GHVN01034388.1.p1  ORF type:complete len:844 (+),score=52.12 GHVN01034388.1:1836-4367(+)